MARSPPSEEAGMLNIPTDLLRTLVTVVDLRSFTKAAHSLGITQPAVSAQIKRLQFLLGYELLDKSAPGVSLTLRGQDVVTAARRILAINDEILRTTGSAPRAETLRIGVSSDCVAARVAPVLARFHIRWPHVRFNVSIAKFDHVVREFNQIDLLVAVLKAQPTVQARHLWLEHPVWVHSQATRIDPREPVPLVSFGNGCACREIAVHALNRGGREHELVFATSGLAGLEAAVAVGLGVTVLPRSEVAMTHLAAWDDAPLPALPDLHCGIFLREGDNRAALTELADDIAAVLRPQFPVAQDAAMPATASCS